MNLLMDFLRRKNEVLMVAYGGLGEFLFQLDLAERLHRGDEKTSTAFLVKGKYTLFSEIVQNAGLAHHVVLYDASGFRYVLFLIAAIIKATYRQHTVVNSFHSLWYRLPTRFLYEALLWCGGRVILSRHTVDMPSRFEQVPYHLSETIWERNNRIASQYYKKAVSYEFPIVSFKQKKQVTPVYLHIHPVGSIPQKSFPVEKLKAVLKLLGTDRKVRITITPNEEVWYVNDSSRALLTVQPSVSYKSSFFSFEEIVAMITASDTFCTVNTGIMWVSIFLGHRTVVIDYDTEGEWNPAQYENVVRLTHDVDSHGKPYQQSVGTYSDGSFYEALYAVTPVEVYDALSDR